MLSKGMIITNKMCSQGDTSTIIYFSKFGEGRGPTAFYFLKNKLQEKPKSFTLYSQIQRNI